MAQHMGPAAKFAAASRSKKPLLHHIDVALLTQFGPTGRRPVRASDVDPITFLKGVVMSQLASTSVNADRRNQDLVSALQEVEERYIAANPESQRFSKLAAARLPGGNTRTTVHFSPYPLYMSGGKGSRLTDVDGHTYVDFINEHTAGIY